MQALEMKLTEKGIYVFVEYSLMNKLAILLDRCSRCLEDSICMDDLRTNFNKNIKTNSDLYGQENRHVILDIYNLFCYLIYDKREDFTFDYNIWWDLNERYFPLPEIDTILDEMEYITTKLYEIIRLDYEKMKKSNMSFAEELAKYVFNPSRIIKFSEQYELVDFTEYLDILN